MKKIVGNKIKELRESHGWTQFQLAKKLNVSRGAVSQYEIGVRTISDDLKVELAKLFNVSIDFLFGLEEKFTGLNIVKPLATPQKSEIQAIYDSMEPALQSFYLNLGRGMLTESGKDLKKILAENKDTLTSGEPRKQPRRSDA